MEEVLDLLQAWGLPELGPSFMKNEINIHSLAALSSEGIKELIPNLGPRTLFLRSWKVWQADFLNNSLNVSFASAAADLSTCDISLSDISVVPIDDSVLEKEIKGTITNVAEQAPPANNSSQTCDSHYIVIQDNNLVNLLKQNFETSSLLNFVGKSLENDNTRNRLAAVICKEILKENKNSPVTSAIYHKWSKEIKTVFPNERITTYYIPPCVTAQGVTHQARGKLVSQLLNLRRKYQKLGILDVKEKKLQSDQASPSPRPLPSFVTLDNSSNIAEDLAWLRSSSEPWDLLQSKWDVTFQKRSKDLRDPNYTVEQYFEEYPALKKPQGYKLLVNDFNNSYPEYMNNLYLNFPYIKITLIKLLKKKQTKDSYCSDVINLADGSHEENHNIAAVLSLPELINTNVITLPGRDADTSSANCDSPAKPKKRKIKDKKWKPSKSESREAFVTHIQDDGYLKLAITKRHQYIIEKGFTPQPYIVILGPSLFNIKSYFVVVNPNTFYNCPNILASVDICFKITWALNLEYSPSTYGPWLFIQKGLYKLSSPYDKGSTSVESLMTDCNLSA